MDAVVTVHEPTRAGPDSTILIPQEMVRLVNYRSAVSARTL